jgi:hypothetical protein
LATSIDRRRPVRPRAAAWSVVAARPGWGAVALRAAAGPRDLLRAAAVAGRDVLRDGPPPNARYDGFGFDSVRPRAAAASFAAAVVGAGASSSAAGTVFVVFFRAPALCACGIASVNV